MNSANQHNGQLLLLQQQQQVQMQHAQYMHPQQQMQQPQQMHYKSPNDGTVPIIQNSNPENTTTSEDSDDSTPHSVLLTGIKRPSQDSNDAVKIQKKPKVQKKKKKRDPNEPQKPVSAYALFFRDTQAAIKGQNPNASFGEVSKIVASMWDALDSEHKDVYKKKTEAAKKEYLKALAAYRASLVSKGVENEQQQRQVQYADYGAAYSGGTGGPSTNMTYHVYNAQQQELPSPQQQQIQHQQLQQHQQQQMGMKKVQYIQQAQTIPQQQHMMPQQQIQMSMQQQHQQQQQLQPLQQQPQQMLQSPTQMDNSINFNTVAVNSNQMNAGMPRAQGNSCIRNGCTNLAVANCEWEDEYCSNECVVSHCRDVFMNWVSTNLNA